MTHIDFGFAPYHLTLSDGTSLYLDRFKVLTDVNGAPFAISWLNDKLQYTKPWSSVVRIIGAVERSGEPLED